jgi:hypothetical protein
MRPEPVSLQSWNFPAPEQLPVVLIENSIESAMSAFPKKTTSKDMISCKRYAIHAIVNIERHVQGLTTAKPRLN